MALYNERVYSYENMQELNASIDTSTDQAGEMVANDLSNHLAFCELEAYNETGKFLYKHPILATYIQEKKLESLRKADPERFMNDLINADKSITRYKSQIKNNKYKNKEELIKWQNLINDYETKLKLMKEIIAR
jgi:hypothetical protein